MRKTTLVPRPTFNFPLSAAIFSPGAPDIRTFRDGIFRQVIDTGSSLVLAEAEYAGTTEDPKLVIAFLSERRVLREDAQRAGRMVAANLSIRDDPRSFYRTVAGNPILADLAVRLYGVRAPATPTVFEALTDSIIEQQISLYAARSIGIRLIRAAGKNWCSAVPSFPAIRTRRFSRQLPSEPSAPAALRSKRPNISEGFPGSSLTGIWTWKGSIHTGTRNRLLKN